MLRRHLKHYPWASEADESVAISMLLSSIMRPVLDTAPMHAIDAPAAGSGKSLLVDCAAILSTGVRAPVMDYGRDPVEASKRLDASLLAGDSLICLDNVEAPLEGSVLCQTLTQATRRIRPLGASVMVTVPCTALIVATGNNLVLRGDIVRRALVCRIDPCIERPELRQFDQDLVAETIDRRAELVAACQTIVRAYLSAEPIQVAPLGSFEQWSRTVRASLIWLGMADPASVIDRTRTSDPSRAATQVIFATWHGDVGDDPTTAAQIISKADDNAELRDALGLVAKRDGELDARALGYWLRSHLDARSGDYVLNQHESNSASAKWIVRKARDGRDSRDVLATRAEFSGTDPEKTGLHAQEIPTIPTITTCRRCDGEGCDWCE